MPIIEVDPRLLGFILRNVLGNAWKYRSDEHRLAITVTSNIVDGKMTGFSIDDNGRGFETSPERSAFDSFVRMSSASGTKGTGLGLSMVRPTADTLGWAVEISSKEGIGTRFTVSGV